MPTEYDPAILQTMADRLYASAKFIVIKYALLGGFLGASTGFAAGIFIDSQDPGKGFIMGVFLGFLGLLFGAFFAQERAFMLRLQAQNILVQVKIEANTRPSGTAAGTVAAASRASGFEASKGGAPALG